MSLAARSASVCGAAAKRCRLSTAAAFGARLGRLAWVLDARHRGVAKTNLRLAFPDQTDAWRAGIARSAFAQAGRTAVETLWSRGLRPDELDTVGRVTGLEHLEQALGLGKGVLLVSAHFGNWELMGLVLSLLGHQLHVVTRPLDDPALEQQLNAVRLRTGNRVIRKDNAARGCLRALQRGAAIAILMDQNTLRRDAVFVPYFGKLAATTPLAAKLHLHTGAPILPAFAVPNGARYRFVIEPPLDRLPDGDRPATAVSLTAAATAKIETYVRRWPSAWLWMHDRWRTRPEAEDFAR